MSASCVLPQALPTMARSSRRRGAKIPGVSTKISCAAPADGDAADQRARRLHLGRDDGDFGADEGVEQSRFADIRRPDQSHEAATRGGGWRRAVADGSTIAAVELDAFARHHGGGGGLLGGALGAAGAFGGSKLRQLRRRRGTPDRDRGPERATSR